MKNYLILVKVAIAVCAFLFSIQDIHSQELDVKQIQNRLLDSLRSNILNERQQMECYVDLYDLSDDSNSQSAYIREVLNRALRLKDQEYIFETLDILCRIHKDTPDSLRYYQHIGEECLKGDYRNFCMAWLKAYPSVRKMDEADKPDEANGEISRYKQHKTNLSDKPQEVRWEMILCSAMECVEYFSPGVIRSEDRITHLENIHRLVSELPFGVSYKFNWYYLTRLEFIYRTMNRADGGAKAVKTLDELERLYDTQFERPFYKRRPYLRIRDRESLRIGVYCELLYLGEAIGRKRADEIYLRMKEYYQPLKSEESRRDFLSSVLPYYSYTEQYDLALQGVNELLAQTDSTDMNRRTELLAKKIELITRWKQHYEEGFNAFWEYNSLMDRTRMEETDEKLAEMRSLFEVDKLKIEQAELQAHYHRIALVAALVLSFVFLAWGFYQYWLKRRLKAAQRALLLANEKVAEESERAKASDRMKTEFLQSMSHEIRTPLNSICGFSALLLNEDIDTEEKKVFPAIIEKNSRQLTDLFESILQVSDLSSSLELFPMEQVDILPDCIELFEAYKQKTSARGLTCVFDSVLTQCLINTNVLYLKYVVEHLLGNAAKFTEAGSIRMSLERIDDKVRISIADTGVGVPADKAGYIFGRFTKLDDFMPGTGLGLYSCRLIVNRLGGSVYLDTSYQGGACFCIELPG
ncbi:HAMP domain-containing sensor histidine kinase [Bacteroides sp.]|uniref:sensor histidine kinase n=1 Tax=Bacteroides sp. TaxID=29523 RepID=UPI00261C2471|nr:HAMP domain-containing sensor histidine kinase [Bacteroides sp.]